MGDNSKTMEVNEFSYEVLSAAVDFMYGIEIPEDFSDDLKSLLHMADQYLMEDLKDAVSFHIGKDLNKENIFDISNLAETFGAMALSEKCAQFIFDNVGAIEDEKLAGMKEGVVMASLAKKFVMESKKLTKMFGKRADLKKLDFGFLGLGIMGSGIVKNLLNSGHTVTVWNRTVEKVHPRYK